MARPISQQADCTGCFERDDCDGTADADFRFERAFLTSTGSVTLNDRARFCGAGATNPKSEARNSKQIRMPEIQMTQTGGRPTRGIPVTNVDSRFEHSDIRIHEHRRTKCNLARLDKSRRIRHPHPQGEYLSEPSLRAARVNVLIACGSARRVLGTCRAWSGQITGRIIWSEHIDETLVVLRFRWTSGLRRTPGPAAGHGSGVRIAWLAEDSAPVRLDGTGFDHAVRALGTRRLGRVRWGNRPHPRYSHSFGSLGHCGRDGGGNCRRSLATRSPFREQHWRTFARAGRYLSGLRYLIAHSRAGAIFARRPFLCDT